MTLGPVEILVLAFPENNFSGQILPELAKVVDDETITIIDGLFVRKDADGAVAFFEFEELGASSEVAAIVDVIDRTDGLISDEDVAELTETLEPNSSAAILVFEHTWVKPLRDAIVAAGGQQIDSIRVPGVVVEEVLAAVAAAEAE
ncbi:DUF6325 family protein [Agromyces italicus]|uniref:DUF6325 family protein n=1 Tax=Agromyces italicus TaxID=279572 RepID=UPI0003B46C52|nr:DUF6325 family protein [Agromyces italicus]